ncbi:hypothetical protein MPL3356_300091 [Mesorhizobium plurifarium]|uniref:Uncharacterized protein n=1 Tax=Mesorhizobium plurifarium TaxID=69974 RepID=A0A090FLA3_MESPL|nr:hypothetical protein MPL3356_300091 [Mesorhizobium plurifarium]
MNRDADEIMARGSHESRDGFRSNHMRNGIGQQKHDFRLPGYAARVHRIPPESCSWINMINIDYFFVPATRSAQTAITGICACFPTNSSNFSDHKTRARIGRCSNYLSHRPVDNK